MTMKAHFIITYKQEVEIDFEGNSGADIKDFHDLWYNDENTEFQNYVLDEIDKARKNLPKPKFSSIALTKIESDETAAARKEAESLAREKNNAEIMPF